MTPARVKASCGVDNCLRGGLLSAVKEHTQSHRSAFIVAQSFVLGSKEVVLFVVLHSLYRENVGIWESFEEEAADFSIPLVISGQWVGE